MHTKLSSTQQQTLQHVLDGYPLVRTIIQHIHATGGQPLLVGGAVRDLLLDIPVKDLDIEIHHLDLQQLEDILRSHGPVSLVGKSFGVLRLHTLDIDWSLPRTDSSGRKPEVCIDPNMNMHDAFRRRDLTINAMGIDLITYELIDPFNGLDDLKNKILRAPDTALFIEDPLRFYRVMQFIGRFEMTPDQTLHHLCKTMNVTHISRERIEVEFEKLFLKSKRPSLGIRWVHSLGRLHELFPELGALVGTAQEADWHPEGDVFEHSMQAVDAAAALNIEDKFTRLILAYAALCHDLGKPYTTQIIKGKLKSHGHDQAGVPLTKSLLHRITHNNDLITAVCKLVKHHMAPGLFVKEGAKPPAYKRLATKLSPDVTMIMLADLAYADIRGRNPESHEPLTIPLPHIDEFVQRAQEFGVDTHSEEPALLGRDIMDIMQPGPKMGDFLRRAYEIQIDEGIKDKEILKQRVIEEINKISQN